MSERAPSPETPENEPEKVELATEATKQAFLERIVRETSGAKINSDQEQEKSIQTDTEMLALKKVIDPPRELQSPRDIIAALDIYKPFTQKAKIYNLKRGGAMESVVMDLTWDIDREKKPRRMTAEDFERAIKKSIQENKESKRAQREMGFTLVTEKELQEVNTLIDRVIREGIKYE